MPGGVASGAGVRGVAGCGEAGEELDAAEVVVGERGAGGVDAGVDGDLGTEVGVPDEELLPTPLASSK